MVVVQKTLLFFRGAQMATTSNEPSLSQEDWDDLMMPDDVFSDEFVKQEIAFMGLDKSFSEDGVVLTLKEIHRRCDDYLNKNYRGGELTCPVLSIDGLVWMSLTPMEIQSNYMAWRATGGLVGMGGLGLGYAPMRAASQEEVEDVYVYENDQRVIDFFLHHHRKREELKKIKVIKVDDLRDTITLDEDFPEFDSFYMDIYQSLLPNEAIDDWKLMASSNLAQEFRFWGQERAYLEGLCHEIIGPEQVPMYDRVFLRKWQRTENSAMQNTNLDYAYIEELLEVMLEWF